MNNNYDMNLARIFKSAEEERFNLKHPYVGTEHLLLAILKNDEGMSNFFKHYNLDYDAFKNELVMIVGNATKSSEINLYTPLLKRVINNANLNAKENNKGILTPKHLVLSLLEEGEGIAIRLLVGMNIDIDDIYEHLNKDSKLFNKKLEIYEIGNILNETVDKNELVVGRDKEIELIIETLLRKKKNNPILIGEAGVGKTAIVEELARRIEKMEVPDTLFNMKIVSLEMGSLVSGTKYRGEFEEKLTKVIKELETNNDIILFIDEIHAMVNAGGAEGAITAGDIFKPALARGKIKVIGATTSEEYHKFFAKDKALMRRFETINIIEPSKEETLNILRKVKREYELHHKVMISDDNLVKIVEYTDKFISNRKNPDKAIDFLDSVCSRVKSCNNCGVEKRKIYEKINELKIKKSESIRNNDYDEALNIYNEELKLNQKISSDDFKKIRKITEKDILMVLENKTNMLLSKNKLKIVDTLKDNVQKKLFNVEDVIDKIIKSIKNNVKNKDGMLKIYLEGEKYLGKSTLVKTIAETLKPTNYLKIDLKDYQSPQDINKLIGTSSNFSFYNDEYIFSKLKNNCFSIVWFANYNEGDDVVKELIKKILEEGVITDNKGEKISFNNSYVFITNDLPKENKVGFASDNHKPRINDLFDLVDTYIYFKPLDYNTLVQYLNTLKIPDGDKIISNSMYEKYNYKNISKLIQKDNYQYI